MLPVNVTDVTYSTCEVNLHNWLYALRQVRSQLNREAD